MGMYGFQRPPLPTTYLAGGPVTTVSGYAMTGCFAGGGWTGAWTKYVANYNGPAVVHNHVYQGSSCPNYISYAHAHPSSYGACYTPSNVAPFYADCKQLQ
jgi:hypothetical protein